MKRITLSIAVILNMTLFLAAQNTPFKFDQARIDTGSLYIYNYSTNKESFEPHVKEYFYIKSINEIENVHFRIEENRVRSFNYYKMNWEYMMPEESKFLSLIDKNDVPFDFHTEASYKVNFDTKTIHYKAIKKTKEGYKDKINQKNYNILPTYSYGGDELLPLWFALRFYPFEKESVTVNHEFKNHESELEIKYLGKETVKVAYGEVLCHKFEFIPKLSFFMNLLSSPDDAWIWLSADENRFMVKYRNNNYKHSLTQSLEYQLEEIRKISLDEWEKIKNQKSEVHEKSE